MQICIFSITWNRAPSPGCSAVDPFLPVRLNDVGVTMKHPAEGDPFHVIFVRSSVSRSSDSIHDAQEFPGQLLVIEFWPAAAQACQRDVAHGVTHFERQAKPLFGRHTAKDFALYRRCLRA